MLPRWFVPQCPVLCVQNSPHSPSQCLLHFLWARECFSLHIYHPPLFMSVRSAFPVFVTDSVTQLGCVYFLPDQKCSFSHDCWSLFDLTSTQGEKNGTSQVYECEKTTQEPSHPAPRHQPTMPTKPTYAPTENTSCSSTCPTQPLPSVTAIFQTLNICQISSILYCKTEHLQLLLPSVQKQNSKQRFIQFPTSWTDFSKKTCLTSSFKTFHDGLNHVTK